MLKPLSPKALLARLIAILDRRVDRLTAAHLRSQIAKRKKDKARAK